MTGFLSFNSVSNPAITGTPLELYTQYKSHRKIASIQMAINGVLAISCLVAAVAFAALSLGLITFGGIPAALTFPFAISAASSSIFFITNFAISASMLYQANKKLKRMEAVEDFKEGISIYSKMDAEAQRAIKIRDQAPIRALLDWTLHPSHL